MISAQPWALVPMDPTARAGVRNRVVPESAESAPAAQRRAAENQQAVYSFNETLAEFTDDLASSDLVDDFAHCFAYNDDDDHGDHHDLVFCVPYLIIAGVAWLGSFL